MSALINYPICIKAGQGLEWDAIYNDSTGAPENLTGYHGEFWVFRAYGSPKLLDLKDTTAGVTLGSDGTIRAFTDHATLLTAVGVGQFIWEFWLTDPSGNPIPLVDGSFTVEPSGYGS